jgi:hypothetical protein
MKLLMFIDAILNTVTVNLWIILISMNLILIGLSLLALADLYNMEEMLLIIPDLSNSVKKKNSSSQEIFEIEYLYLIILINVSI